MPKAQVPFNRKKLMRERIRQGLTLRHLSDLTAQAGKRVTHTTLRRWETGEFCPTPARLPILAAALNLQVDTLLIPDSELERESA